MKNIYQVQVKVTEYHSVEVEAESLDEALGNAEELGVESENAYSTDVEAVSATIGKQA